MCSPQAQINITIAEAEAADASAQQWLRRQNIGRAGGEPCKKQDQTQKALTKQIFRFLMKQNKEF